MAPKKAKKLSRKDLASPEGRFATHFMALLDERGWTKEQFSERSGIPDPTIRKWLRAESMPLAVETLEAIAKALDTRQHPLTDYRFVLPPPR